MYTSTVKFISVVYEGLNGSQNLKNNLTLIIITWIHSQAFVKSAYKKKSYFSTKTYVVSTQKNCLSETVQLAPKTYVKTDG